MLPTLDLRVEDPNQPEIIRLLEASNGYYRALYPDESNHLLSATALQATHIAFYVARFSHVACGFGAIVKYDGYAELKRMYIDPPARRRGIGRQILDTLEAHAARDGYRLVRLETGIKQPEAIALYREHGYYEIDPFGRYAADPLSIFMEKRLAAPGFIEHHRARTTVRSLKAAQVQPQALPNE